MIVSITKKTISLAISLLVVVISLTGVALGAGAPNVETLTNGPNGNGRYTPGFAGAPGKMARDAAGNFYVADFWGKGIIKLTRNGVKSGFIPTTGRPTAVAVMKNDKLVVAMTTPRPKIAIYEQRIVGEFTTGEESTTISQDPSLFRPVAITTSTDIVSPFNEYIYVLDSGDSSNNAVNNVGKIRVYSPAGSLLYATGFRTATDVMATTITSTSDARLKQPSGIAYEKNANKIYVADTMNSRLLIFNAFNGSSMDLVPTTPGPGSFIGKGTGLGVPVVGSNPVTFGNPVDVTFQYDDSALQRIYVAERGRNEISVLDPATKRSTKLINNTTLSGAAMKLPSALLFERTGTGAETKGVLYVTNAAAATAANILALGIDTGTVPPVATVAMAFNPPVPAVSPSTPITVEGTTAPGTAVTCTVNGVADGTSSGAASWRVIDLDLQPGMNYIRCTSATGGAFVEASTYHGTATTAPTVAITQPAGTGTIYTGVASLTVSGTTTPGSATVKLVNSLPLPLGSTTTIQSDINGNWSTTLTLTEGINQITATASKPGTPVSAAVIRTVVYDKTDPVITDYSFISEGATTTNAVQNFDGIVNEANLHSITVNNVPIAATAQVTLAGNNTYFSIPVTLNRGANTVTVTATDKVNRKNTFSRTVTLAPEKPGFITIDQPADNKFRSSAVAESASGKVDPSFDSVNACGGTSVDPDLAGNWSTTTASSGASFVSCQLTASGGGNATVNEKRTFITGAAYGPVAITSPASDLATKIAAVTVTGSVAPGVAIPQISINGAAAIEVGTYDSGTGAFTHPVTLLPGLNTIKIITTAAPVTTAVRNIIYDTAAPDLSIQADSKPMPTFIYGSLEPSVKISAITASIGTPATPVIIPVSDATMKFDTYDQSGAVTWKADLTGFAYDKISFTAIDPAGNESTLPYANGIPTGDIDGDGTVRLADALAALRHVAGTELINPVIEVTKFFNGDVGGLVKGRVARDGAIDISDAVLILNKAYGLMAF